MGKTTIKQLKFDEEKEIVQCKVNISNDTSGWREYKKISKTTKEYEEIKGTFIENIINGDYRILISDESKTQYSIGKAWYDYCMQQNIGIKDDKQRLAENLTKKDIAKLNNLVSTNLRNPKKKGLVALRQTALKNSFYLTRYKSMFEMKKVPVYVSVNKAYNYFLESYAIFYLVQKEG